METSVNIRMNYILVTSPAMFSCWYTPLWNDVNGPTWFELAALLGVLTTGVRGFSRMESANFLLDQETKWCG
jgi:hypothetical protein